MKVAVSRNGWISPQKAPTKLCELTTFTPLSSLARVLSGEQTLISWKLLILPVRWLCWYVWFYNVCINAELWEMPILVEGGKKATVEVLQLNCISESLGIAQNRIQ